MNRTRLVLTGMAAAVALIFNLATTAGAAPIFYSMTLTAISGPLTGTTGTGSFSIESSLFSGIGWEEFGPTTATDSSIIAGLLSFDVQFNGENFTISDALFSTNFPRVSFSNGSFIQYNNYMTGYGAHSMDIGTNSFGYIGAGGTVADQSGGPITTYLISAVPLPAALPLFLSGLAGIGLIGRKRRKRGNGALAA